jgi:hypothetical protein
MPRFSQRAVPFPMSTLRQEQALDRPLAQLQNPVAWAMALAVAPATAPAVTIGWDVIHSYGILGGYRWGKDISAIMEFIM